MHIEPTRPAGQKVAIVHDWLTQRGGAELVLEQLLHLYPQADLYTLVDALPEEDRACLRGHKPITSFVHSLPFARTHHRAFLPLMPLAVEQWDFSAYDLVISSCYAVVKGLITGPDQVHVSYVHSPMRYAWDLQGSYLRQSRMSGMRGWAARYLLHRLRLWDQVASQRVDHFIANSSFVARRIDKLYRRPALVVPPPVALDRFQLSESSEPFFLTVSRLVPYKRVDLIAEAFAAMPEHKLVIIGDGPEQARVQAHRAPNITFLGRQSDAVVTEMMGRCRAFIFAAIEDFGIAPLEAQACGKPVIALRQGGATETLTEDTAVFFDSQDVDSLRAALGRFERIEARFTPQACRDNALRFSPERFRQAMVAAVTRSVNCPKDSPAPHEFVPG
jgi:glycosyltransferase involved in cell wall biosynthesis